MAGGYTDYTVRDLVFYASLFGGIIIVSQWMGSQFQTHRIVNLLCGGAAGFALGTMLQRTYDNMKSTAGKDRDFPGDDQLR
ncbi:MAG: hypothetical protein H8E37_03620 [Planctomycetes bacterium]|nr:hypothetical protein [Planctomycetota bacterium]